MHNRPPPFDRGALLRVIAYVLWLILGAVAVFCNLNKVALVALLLLEATTDIDIIRPLVQGAQTYVQKTWQRLKKSFLSFHAEIKIPGSHVKIEISVITKEETDF